MIYLLVGVGLAAPFFGFHDLFAQALAPFGVGLIFSDALSGVGRSGGLRVRLRSRRDE